MISAAVGRGGETMISAQTIEAFWNAMEHVAALGRAELLARARSDVSVSEELGGEGERRDFVLSECGAAESSVADWVRSGAGDMARYLGEFARGGLINIAGGCCGNTPEHIAAIAKALEGQPRASCRQPTSATPARLGTSAC